MSITLPPLAHTPGAPASVSYPLRDIKSSALLCLSLYESSAVAPASYSSSSSVLAGYECLQATERTQAASLGSDLLYGELMPQGVAKALSPEHLDAPAATSFYDLGMGLGKFALLAFLSHPGLTRVVGVELAQSRYKLAVNALALLASHNPSLFRIEKPNADVVRLWMSSSAESVQDGKQPEGKSASNKPAQRLLEFRRQNLYECEDCLGPTGGDIVICELEIPASSWGRFTGILDRMKTGARLMMLKALPPIYAATQTPMPFAKISLECFATTWDPKANSARLGIFRKIELDSRANMEKD